MSQLHSEIARLDPSALVNLYQLDLTDLGGIIYYFYPGTQPNSETDPANPPLFSGQLFNGQVYSPWGISTSGFKASTTGSNSRPSMTVGNLGQVWTPILKLYKNMIGAKVTRIRTLAKFLDTGATPDPNQKVEEVYFINTKTAENSEIVEWELASGMDVEDAKLPGRTMIANICSWVYRKDGQAPDPLHECPWPRTDPAKYFDIDGNSTGVLADDDCGKTLSDCQSRYGFTTITLPIVGAVKVSSAPLPFSGFPGLRRR